MYHSVNPTADKFSITPRTFRRHMRWIRDNYPVVPLSSVRNHLSTVARRHVVLTFDDAFDDFETFAYPVLAEYRLPATVFVPTGYCGKTNEWDRYDPSIAPKRVMDGGQLRRIVSGGLIELGSHTVEHFSMRGLKRSEMRRQAVDSRRWLEDVIGRPITMFSYPYGQRRDMSPTTEEVVRDAGYDLAVSTCWGTRNSLTYIMRLRRIWFVEQDDDTTTSRKMEGWYDWIGLKEMAGFVRWGLASTLGGSSRRRSRTAGPDVSTGERQ